ncbi:ABC transporter permease [Actinomadura syzygii]|uniref:ABC transporter permease subunit n=1 Tax=Actinomadura syzygii TaxID=1427538 RepID=A0A5D0U638_9ACTN|nr:ABC transporter permease subunit [Actinomadura syzygii]TYC13205.1 ABC transporter permease subunit [Actinomadura syzygii]
MSTGETVRPTAGAAADRRGAGGPRARWRPSGTVLGIAGVLAVWLVGWELTVRAGVISRTFAATPTEVVREMVGLAGDAGVRSAFASAIGMFLVAFAIAAAAGVLAGAAMGLSKIAYRTFHPLVLGLFSTPKMIFIPIFILIAGFGATSKISYGAVSGFFPVAVTVTAGVRMVDQRLLVAARSMGASRLQTLRGVVMPGSLPAVMAALWYGMKHALLGVLIMELFASQRGIGHYIDLYSSNFRPDRVFALVFGLALFAVLLGSLWRWQEKRLSRWKGNHG